MLGVYYANSVFLFSVTQMGRKKPRLPSLAPEIVELEEEEPKWGEFSPTAPPYSTGTIPRQFNGNKPPLHHRESSHLFSEYIVEACSFMILKHWKTMCLFQLALDSCTREWWAQQKWIRNKIKVGSATKHKTSGSIVVVHDY